MITIHGRLTVGVPQANGFGALLPTSCLITEEINGGYNLTLVHPKDEYGKWQRLQNGRLLLVPTPYGIPQLFRIKTVKKSTIDGTITVTAKHRFYDLLSNKILDTRPTAENGQTALQQGLGGTQYASGFTGTSDILTISTAYWIDKNPVSAFISSDDNSFISRWGGEIHRDNLSFSINTRIGSDTGRTIRYGKNLEGVDATEDETGMFTRVRLSGLDEQDNAVCIESNGGFVDSPLIGTYGVIIGGAKCDDVKIGKVAEDGTIPYPDIASVRAELLRRSLLLFEKGADKPAFTLEVTFVELSDTDEYKDFVALQPLLLGDGLTVRHAEYDIDYSLRMTAYEYDAIEEEYTKITLGDKQPNLGQSIVDAGIDISILKQDLDGTVRLGRAVNAVTFTKETGLLCDTDIYGHNIKTYVNATSGIEIKRDNVQIFGIDSITGMLTITGVADEAAVIAAQNAANEAQGSANTAQNSANTANGLIISLAPAGLVELAKLGTTVISGGYIKTSLLTASNIITGTLMDATGKSWISLADGTFSFGSGALAWNGSTLTAKGIFTAEAGTQKASVEGGAIKLYNSGIALGYLAIQTTGPTGPWLTAAASASTIRLAKEYNGGLYTGYLIDWGSASGTTPAHTFWGAMTVNGALTVPGTIQANKFQLNPDPLGGGGGGDTGTIEWVSYGGEDVGLRIAVTNDAGDKILLSTPGINGVLINGYVAWHDGNAASKLDGAVLKRINSTVVTTPNASGDVSINTGLTTIIAAGACGGDFANNPAQYSAVTSWTGGAIDVMNRSLVNGAPITSTIRINYWAIGY